MDEIVKDLPIERRELRVATQDRDAKPAADRRHVSVVDKMDRPAAAEEAGEIDQVAVDEFLDEQREPEGPRRQRLCLRTRAAGEHALPATRLVDLHHERIAEPLAGSDEGIG